MALQEEENGADPEADRIEIFPGADPSPADIPGRFRRWGRGRGKGRGQRRNREETQGQDVAQSGGETQGEGENQRGLAETSGEGWRERLAEIPGQTAGDPAEAETEAETWQGYSAKSGAYRRITLALFLAGLVTFALLYETQPLLPIIGAEFSRDAASAALTVSLTTAGLALGLILAGPSSEYLGRRPVIFVSIVASSLVSLASPLMPNWELLLASRALLGVTLAGLPAVALAYLAEEVEARAHAKAAGIYIGASAVGGMTGRLIVGFLAHYFTWQVSLLVLGGFSFLCALAVMALLPASRGFTKASPGLKALWYATRDIVKDRGFLALYGIAACGMGAFVALFNMLGYRLEAPPYLLSVAVTGLIFLVYPLGSLSSMVCGVLAGRFGQRRVAPVAAFSMLIGLLLTLATPLWLIVLGLAVFTMGFFGVHGVASGWVSARAKAKSGSIGQASSAYSVMYYAGSSVFGALVGYAWTAGAWWGVVAMTGALTLIVLGLTIVLRFVKSLRVD